jgi:sugar lactone lactonase YvrE
MKTVTSGVALLLFALSAGCGGCGSGDDRAPAEMTYTVGGMLAGLASAGTGRVGTGFELVLTHSGASEILPVGVDGPFTFRTRLADGAAYQVAVWAQPYGQQCQVAGGAGTVPGAPVTSVTVSCTLLPTFTVGGTVSGLTGAGLVLANTNPGATDLLPVGSDGPFTFPAQPDGTSYRVTVRDRPAGQSCAVAGGEGTVSGGDLTGVTVTCTPLPTTFTVGGTVVGLSSGNTLSLVLNHEGASDLLAITASGAFTFPVPLAPGVQWEVGIDGLPAGQTCTVANGTGTIAAADVDDVVVTCDTPGATYTIGGIASGLTGPGLVLSNTVGSAVDTLAIDASGGFTFLAEVADGASYLVAVTASPAGQACEVVNGSGTVAGFDVTNVGVTCRTLRLVGGTVGGLAGGAVTLRNSTTADEVTVSADGPFSFGVRVPDGRGYAVTVTSQPPGRSCLVAGGTGTVNGADVTSVVVTCEVAVPLVYSVYAGDMGGPGNADGVGPDARFNLPMGLAGGLVADRGNNRLRSVAPDGTTVAASGPGFRYEDGPLGSAFFLAPQAMVDAPSGVLHVADTGHHVIRRIEAGMVTTVAGYPSLRGSQDGVGNAARFDSPGGVAVAPDGTVYVADTLNHTIRRVTPAGEVTTLAGVAGQFGGADGTGAEARFFYPVAIAADPTTGTIYVGDTNRRIRAVTPAGVVTTVAGSVAGFADSPDPLLAKFQSLDGMAIDSAGTIYVADAQNHVVRRVDASGVSTFAGVPRSPGSEDGARLAARFSGPSALDLDGNWLWVADTNNHTVRRIDLASGEVTTVAGAPALSGTTDGSVEVARFKQPMGVAAGSQPGVVFVADRYGHNVRRIDPDPVTGGASTVTTVAGSGSGVSGSSDGNGPAARFREPWGITAGGHYVGDSANRTLRHVDDSGTVTTVAGAVGVPGVVDGVGSAARFLSAAGVWTAPGGEVYVADTYAIRRFDPATGEVTTVAGASSGGFQDGVGGAARFKGAEGIVGDAAGNLYVADTLNASVRKILPGGVVVTLTGGPTFGYQDGPVATAQFQSPRDLAVDDGGNLYVADEGNECIRRISAAGEVTTVIGTPGLLGFSPAATPSAIGAPRKLVLDGDVLYVTMYQGVARFVLPPPP